MWYVIQVVGGQEEKTACLIRNQISLEVLSECFIPQKERIKKFRGDWRKVKEILFPGYVFAVTELPEELFLELKAVTRLTKLLQDGVFHFIPLSEAEEKMICSIGDQHHVTRLSKVRLNDAEPEKTDENNLCCGQKVVILDGPLKKQEGRIVKYNFHKREVTVRIPFMGNEMDLRLGVELVSEKEKRI